MARVTPAIVRRALLRKYGKDNDGTARMAMYRSPSGYYYFTGSRGNVASLMQYDLEGETVESIMRYVERELADYDFWK